MDSKLRYLVQVVYADGSVYLSVTTERPTTVEQRLRDRVIQNQKIPGWIPTTVIQQYVSQHMDEIGESEILDVFTDTCAANESFNEMFDLAITSGINLLNTNKKNTRITNPNFVRS